MRQTIIGVAAPANAPPHSAAAAFPQAKVEAPPYTTTAASLQAKVEAPPQQLRVASRPNMPQVGRPRPAANRTIIGGLEAAPGAAPGPPPAAIVPTATNPAATEAKRTILGGLEAAPGSASAIGLGIPSEARWNVLFPKQGAVEMTGPELVRAYVEGKITRETNVWRDGLDGWKPLHSVDSLRSTFSRAGLSIDETAAEPESRQEDQKATSARSPADNRTPKSNAGAPAQPTRLGLTPKRDPVSDAPPTAREPALTDVTGELFDAETPDDSEEVTRIAASPWEVPDVGAKAMERLASSAGLPPRQKSLPPRVGDPAAPDPLPERPSKRPDINPRDTVRGQLRPLSSIPAPMVATEEEPPQVPRGTSPAIPSVPTTAQAATTRPPPSPLGRATSPIAPAIATTPGKDDDPSARPAPLPAQLQLTQAPRSRLKRHLTVAAVCLLGFMTLLAISYRTKQPNVLHRYLHHRGWDVPIERTVNATANHLKAASQRYLVTPWRALTERTKRNTAK